MLIREALAQGSADLKFADIKTPSLDASVLLAFLLKTNRTSLLTAGTETISEKICKKYCKLIERRSNGECVAYITGKKEFMGLEFTVNKYVLVPRPDTETLVEAAQQIIDSYISKYKPQSTQSITEKEGEKIKVLDLCTGSGAIAISLKHELPELEVYATDICPKALKIAKQNSQKLLGKNKIQFLHGDLFSVNSSPKKFSLIVSNPPYIPSAEIKTLSAEVQNEPLLALDGGESGLEIIERIINNAPDYLVKGGFLLLEAHPPLMENIKQSLAKRGFKDIQLYKDLSDSFRVIGGKYEE
ncbi:MAG: peptide chain release factor N(5)-glutamine methyltransferase [Treponema sp.]|nr:peptide chain release factor N(5)-glutamine methyltransferase [Treponema sp.]